MLTLLAFGIGPTTSVFNSIAIRNGTNQIGKVLSVLNSSGDIGYVPAGGAGATNALVSINGDTNIAQIVTNLGTGITVSTVAGTTTISNSLDTGNFLTRSNSTIGFTFEVNFRNRTNAATYNPTLDGFDSVTVGAAGVAQSQGYLVSTNNWKITNGVLSFASLGSPIRTNLCITYINKTTTRPIMTARSYVKWNNDFTNYPAALSYSQATADNNYNDSAYIVISQNPFTASGSLPSGLILHAGFRASGFRIGIGTNGLDNIPSVSGSITNPWSCWLADSLNSIPKAGEIWKAEVACVNSNTVKISWGKTVRYWTHPQLTNFYDSITGHGTNIAFEYAPCSTTNRAISADFSGFSFSCDATESVQEGYQAMLANNAGYGANLDPIIKVQSPVNTNDAVNLQALQAYSNSAPHDVIAASSTITVVKTTNASGTIITNTISATVTNGANITNLAYAPVIVAGSNVTNTKTTNTLTGQITNTIAATGGGGGSGIATQDGKGTNTTIIAESGVPLRVAISASNGSDPIMVLGTNGVATDTYVAEFKADGTFHQPANANAGLAQWNGNGELVGGGTGGGGAQIGWTTNSSAPSSIAGTNDTYIIGQAINGGTFLVTNAAGSIAGGIAEDGGVIQVQGEGSTAFGYANGAGSYIGIDGTEVDGSYAYGVALDGGKIRTTYYGAAVWGYASGGESELVASYVGVGLYGSAQHGGKIIGTGAGAFLFGASDGTNSLITSTGSGSLSHGLAGGYGGIITASGAGAHAHGSANFTDSRITASGDGATAFGNAMKLNGEAEEVGTTIIASGKGGFAGGVENVSSTEDDAFAYGKNITNSTPSSFLVGFGGENLLVTTDGVKIFNFLNANANQLKDLSDGTDDQDAATVAQIIVSDRNKKQGLKPAPRDALEKLLKLPVYTYQFTNSPSVGHLGVMAQDFYESFGLGKTNTQIDPRDASGVAIVSIQQLNAKQEVRFKILLGLILGVLIFASFENHRLTKRIEALEKK